MNHDHASANELNPMDRLLAKLSEQQATINKQHEVLQTGDDLHRAHVSSAVEYAATSAGSSLSITPVTNSTEGTASGNSTDTIDSVEEKGTPHPSKDEVLRLKIELEKAKGKIARMDQELTQTRITKHTIEQAIGSNSEADFPMDQLNATGRSVYLPDGTWATQDDNHSDHSDALSASGFNRAGGIWGNSSRAPLTNYHGGMHGLQPASRFPGNPWAGAGRGFNLPYSDPSGGFSQTHPGLRSDRLASDNDGSIGLAGDCRNANRSRFMNRNPGAFPYAGSNSSYDGITPTTSYSSVAGLGGAATGTMGTSIGLNAGAALTYQPQPIGTPLSPFAPEFNSLNGQWKNDNTIAVEGQTFLPTTEPLNYRRLLDRTVNCNWKYIVDKIVCNNDQQASIFLQQKLKVGTTEQKYDIVEAIVAQAYPLMINRFGNFLVQRCFEHGTPEQVIKIAEAIRGNTLNLSMDAFGCHVVQKAFDSVPEDYKAIMVHELLRRIPETVIHRYACHVWQKLFELRWAESPPQIMKFVNEALRGMWHEVALGETGSLVVQNIFENCLEEDKVSYQVCTYLPVLTYYSAHASKKFLLVSTSLPMVSSEIGASSTFASMERRLTVAVLLTTSSAMRLNIAWTNSPPKLLKSASRLVEWNFLVDILTVSAKAATTVHVFHSLILPVTNTATISSSTSLLTPTHSIERLSPVTSASTWSLSVDPNSDLVSVCFAPTLPSQPALDLALAPPLAQTACLRATLVLAAPTVR